MAGRSWPPCHKDGGREDAGGQEDEVLHASHLSLGFNSNDLNATPLW